MNTAWQLFIDGTWADSQTGKSLPVINPATGEQIATVACAEAPDLDRALAAADKGFHVWRKVSVFDRAKLMRKAADLLRARADDIGRILTMEQGKPLAEAKGEVLFGADVIDWFAEEGRRSYGRIIPSRSAAISQFVVKEPVGPVAAFTPWNFPINQAVRKIAAAVAAGCSIILKGPEEAPGPCVELVRAFADAGLPSGVVNLVFGVPSFISEHLIPSPIIRKVSFTGSTAVGKRLAALAGQHMKRVTMELGGHAPVIVFDDADLDVAAKVVASNKYRNAGQVCIAPTRFLIQRKAYDAFVEKFLAATARVRVGDGLKSETTMGPLAHQRRVGAMEQFVADAVAQGARVETGGGRVGENGFFFAPTVLTGVGQQARIMNEEPFGPLSVLTPFGDIEEAVTEANRLPYGLAAYAWTRSAETAQRVGSALESGMVSINHFGLALPETPFGGVKDSGYGNEGGPDAIEDYLNSKFISRSGI